MTPEELEKLHILSGEYVLGVLDFEAARRVEAELATNPDLRRAVAFWESRLQGLSTLASPAEPPAGTWDAIVARLPPSAAMGVPAPRLWNSIAMWRWSTAAAGALAACLALYIALARPAAGPSYVAVLRPPQQDVTAWVATAGADGLLLRAVSQVAAPSDRSFELWAIAPGATRPQALGLIAPDGRLELGALPAALRDGGTLAISIEPVGGSPTGQPTRPVVFSGMLVAER
jgi:anti-sigma-K factor RskA